MKKILACDTSLNEDSYEMLLHAGRSSRGEMRNQYTEKASKAICKYTNRKHCLLLAHCTDALILSLKVLGIGENDKVLVPSLTWVASASAILHVGAMPVFVDVERDSYCIDLDSIKKMKQQEIKAIIGVQLLGNLFDREIEKYCEDEGIYLIEDAAEGLGAYYKENPKGQLRAGKIGKISCLSFHATKIINAYQGGALLTDDDEVYDRAKRISHHGIDTKISNKYYWSNELGYNMAYSDIQASLIFSQMRCLDDYVDNRKRIFLEYEKCLSESKVIEVMPRIEGERNSVYWLPTVLVKPEFQNRDLKEKVIESAQRFNIEIRPLFYPLHSMPTFKNYECDELNTTNLLSREGFTLPTGNNMSVSVATEAAYRLLDILKSVI